MGVAAAMTRVVVTGTGDVSAAQPVRKLSPTKVAATTRARRALWARGGGGRTSGSQSRRVGGGVQPSPSDAAADPSGVRWGRVSEGRGEMDPVRPVPRRRRTLLRWRILGWVVVSLLILLLTYAVIDLLGRLGQG